MASSRPLKYLGGPLDGRVYETDSDVFVTYSRPLKDINGNPAAAGYALDLENDELVMRCQWNTAVTPPLVTG